MFSMAFAPDYAASGRFYVFFTRDGPVTEPCAADRGIHALVGESGPRRPGDPRDVLVIPHPDG